MTRGKYLIGAVLVFGSIGLALSACVAPGPAAAYANGYYYYPGYYDPGYTDSFGFVRGDRDRDRHHDHDDRHDHGMHDGNYAAAGEHGVPHGDTVSHGIGERAIAGGRGGIGGRR